jgi:hypothetical protein
MSIDQTYCPATIAERLPVVGHHAQIRLHLRSIGNHRNPMRTAHQAGRKTESALISAARPP